jgi:hypothetical protein
MGDVQTEWSERILAKDEKVGRMEGLTIEKLPDLMKERIGIRPTRKKKEAGLAALPKAASFANAQKTTGKLLIY